jgi:predicted phage-related endonuclease
MSLTEAQLAKRRTGVTATDLCALLGVDAYGRTAHDVFLDKMGLPSKFEETEAMDLGNALEPLIIPRLAAKVGLCAQRRDPESLTIAHPKHPTHIATPDAFLASHAFTDPEAIGQVKVVGFQQARRWGDHPRDPVPDGVLVQCSWELHVSGMTLDWVGALLGTEVRVYPIRLEDVADLIGEAIPVADRFWRDHVVTRKPPKLDGSAGSERMIRALYPTSDPGSVKKADERAEAFAARCFRARKVIAEAKEEEAKARQALLALAGSCETMRGDGWRLRCKTVDGYTVKARAYEVPAGRRFDLRPRKVRDA